MLNYLKSDLQIQMTDNQGNVIQKPQQNPPPSSPNPTFNNTQVPVRNDIKEQERKNQQEQQQNNPFAPPKPPVQSERK